MTPLVPALLLAAGIGISISGDATASTRPPVATPQDGSFIELTPDTAQESLFGTTRRVASGVYFHNGEYHVAERLMYLPGLSADAGPDNGLRLELHYRSRIDYDGPYGFGWDLSVHERVDETSDGTLHYYPGTGRREAFSGFDASDGVWTVNPPGRYGVFAKDAGSADARYVYTDRDGTVRSFDELGRLDHTADRWGHQVDYFYERDDLPLLLTRIHDSIGRDLQLAYSDLGRLTALTDFSGRSVAVEHDDDGNLIAIRSYAPADGRPGSSATRDTLFDYDGPLPHKLTRVTMPNGTVFLENSFFTTGANAGRVSQQVQEGMTWFIDYDAAGAACRVTGSDGRRRTWGSAAPGSPLPTWRKTWSGTYSPADLDAAPSSPATRPTAQAVLTTTYSYDAGGDYAKIVYPAGNSVRYTRDAHGNMTERRRKVNDAAPDNGTIDLVETFTHDAAHWDLQRTQVGVLGAQTQYFYDYDEAALGDLNADGITSGAAGVLVRVVHPDQLLPNGSVLSPVRTMHQYDAHGQETLAIDENGDAIRYEYWATNDASLGAVVGTLRAVTKDPGGLDLRTELTCDPFGNRTSETSPRGYTTTWVRNQREQVIEIQHPAPGEVVEQWYDLNDRVVEERIQNLVDGVVQPNQWLSTTLVYNSFDEVLERREEIDATHWRTTVYTYTARQQLASETVSTGTRTEHQYDDFHLLWKTTHGANDPGSAATETLDYDTNANLVTHTDSLNRITRYFYDGYDRRFAHIDPDGSVVVAYLRKDGSPSQLERYDGIPGGGGVLIWRDYRFYDHAARTIATAEDGLGSPVGFRIERVFRDEGGRPTLQEDADGGQTHYVYDAAGRRITKRDAAGNEIHSTFDDDGNLAREDRIEAGGDTYSVEHDHDGRNRLTSSVRLGGGGQPQAVTYAYDSLSRTVEHVAVDGLETHYVFDGVGNTLSQSTWSHLDAGGSVVERTERFAYDSAGRQTSYEDDTGQVQSYVYDARGRLAQVWVAGSTTPSSVLTYDIEGNLLNVTEASGTKITYVRDSMNRVLERHYQLAPNLEGVHREVFDYTSRGQLESATNYTTSSGAVPYTVVTREYDGFGELAAESTGLLGGANLRIEYARSAGGSLQQITYPSGLAVTHLRDGLDQLTHVHADGALVASFDRPGFDRLTRLTFGNGTAFAMDAPGDYDAFARPVHYRHELPGGAAFLERTYSYSGPSGPSCTCTEEIQWIRDDLSGTYDVYGYDLGGRLTQARLDAADSAGSGALRSLDYAYTGAQGSFASIVDSQSGTTVYCPDSSHQYKAVGGAALSCPPPRRNLRYDVRGNLIHDSHAAPTRTFYYDVHNHVVRANSGGSLVATYGYDALGRRVQRADAASGELRRFVFDGLRVVEERVGAGELTEKRFVYGERGLDDRLRYERWQVPGQGTPATWFLHTDHLASVLAATDAGGAVVERYEYLPYGEVGFFDPAGVPRGASLIDLRYLYTGRYWEPALGVYDYRARTYDPVLGRFLQRDPMGSLDGPNPYEYAGSNPISFNDPRGLEKDKSLECLDGKKTCTTACTKWFTFDSTGCLKDKPKGKESKADKEAREAANKDAQDKIDKKKKEFMDALRPWSGHCPCKDENAGPGCDFVISPREAKSDKEKAKAAKVTFRCGAKLKTGEREHEGQVDSEGNYDIHMEADSGYMTHEHGHGLGMRGPGSDKYEEDGKTTKPKKGYENHVMADKTKPPHPSELCQVVADNGLCPEATCCPKSTFLTLAVYDASLAANKSDGESKIVLPENGIYRDEDGAYMAELPTQALLRLAEGQISAVPAEGWSDSILPWTLFLQSLHASPYPIDLKHVEALGHEPMEPLPGEGDPNDGGM